MIIKVIDAEKLMIRMADFGHPDYYKNPYKVLAIRNSCRTWQYLVEDHNRLKWWDMDLFEVIDETIPEDWVEIQYKRFHKYKNRKYDFSIPTRYYNGPKAFIDNEDFLFDIYEEASTAYKFYQDYMRKKV